MNAIATAYTGAEIFDGLGRHQNTALVVRVGRNVDICHDTNLPLDIERQELDGGLLAPGLVDLQVNGGGGVMFNNAPAAETISTICEAHGRRGTTSLLPTLVSDTVKNTQAAIAAAREAIASNVPGMAGLHLEGPHLSITRKGAHDPALIRPMTEKDCRAMEELAAEIPSLLLTVAPESASPMQIGRLKAAGAVVSLGHTDCSFETAVKAAQSGAACATHLFNAMSQLGSREPGLVGAVLETGAMHAGVIADGFHSDAASIRIALRAKSGPGRIFLVSDSMATIGSEITEFTLNGRRILRSKGRLTLPDGKLAGADIDLISAVRFMVSRVGLEVDEALRMATFYPAQLLGRSAEIGTLRPNSRADFVHLNDDLQVIGVWRDGQPLVS